MAGSSVKRRSAASRVFTGVILVAVLLFAALTAGWFYLARELDTRVQQAIEAAAGRGVTIACAERDVFGYPFRLGLACDSVAIDAPESGVRATGGQLRTAAQIYEPRRIVMELGAPVAVDAPDLPPLELGWNLGQASARYANDGLERMSIAIDAPTIALREAGVELARAEHFEVHSRRNGPDLDLALSDRALTVTHPDLGTLPTFDVAADMSVAGAADWLTDGLPGGRVEEALRGRQGTLRQLRVALAEGGAMEVSGPFSFAPSGEVTGDFRIALENPNAIASLVGQLVPGGAAIANTLAGGLGLVGRQENGRTVVDVQVRDGRAQLGFIPLGRIPPI